jgi:hypothetical protein
VSLPRVRPRHVCCAMLVLALTPTAQSADKTIFIELPVSALPTDVAANGTVVGSYREPSGFYWMPTTGDIFIGGAETSAVSRNGRTIVGTALDSARRQQAAIWQRASEWRLLGSIVPNATPCDALLSSTYDVSDDGRVIVGLAWNVGATFRAAWSSSDLTEKPRESRDGVGHRYRRAARVHDSAGPVLGGIGSRWLYTVSRSRSRRAGARPAHDQRWLHVGRAGGTLFSSRWGVEALWTQQSSALRIDSGADREGSSGSPQLVK